MKRSIVEMAAGLGVFLIVSAAWAQAPNDIGNVDGSRKVKAAADVPGANGDAGDNGNVAIPPNGSNVPAGANPAVINAAPGAAVQTQVTVPGAQVTTWRYRRHAGRWWYWTPGNTWMYHHNNTWNAYVPQNTVQGYAQPGYVQPGYVQPGYVRPGYRAVQRGYVVQPGIAVQPGYAVPPSVNVQVAPPGNAPRTSAGYRGPANAPVPNAQGPNNAGPRPPQDAPPPADADRDDNRKPDASADKNKSKDQD